MTRLAVSLVLVAALASGAEAQDRFDLKIGLGPTVSTHSGMGPGIHGLVSAELFPIEVIGLRLDGFAGITDYRFRGWLPGEDSETVEARQISRGIEPLYSANLAIVLREPPGKYRLYGILGVGFNYFEQWSQWHPVKHDFGTMFGGGLMFDLGGHSWFVELTGHAFGNVLTSLPTDTKSFAPLTFGLRF